MLEGIILGPGWLQRKKNVEKKKVHSGDLMCYVSQILLSQPCGGQEHGQGCVGTFATSPVITWSNFGHSGDEVPPGWVLRVPEKLTDGARHVQSPPESRVWDRTGARGSCRQPRAISLPHDRSRARSLRWSLEHLLGGSSNQQQSPQNLWTERSDQRTPKTTTSFHGPSTQLWGCSGRWTLHPKTHPTVS